MKSDQLNEIYKKITSLSNAFDGKLLSSEAEETQIRLIADESVSPGMFKRSHLDHQIYYATKTTISAVKENLFVLGEGFEDLEDIRICSDCSKALDHQFWKFCPYCEGQLKK